MLRGTLPGGMRFRRPNPAATNRLGSGLRDSPVLNIIDFSVLERIIRVAWNLLAALVFGAAAFVVSLIIVNTAAGSDWQVMIGASTVAAAVIGVLIWTIVQAIVPRLNVLHGIAAGLVVGLVAHYPAWYFATLYFFFTGARSSLGEATLNPVDGLGGSLIFTLASLFLTGWITAPVGAVAGAALALFQSRSSA